VRHQLTHRKGAPRILELRCAVVILADVHLQLLELGDIARYRIVQLPLPFFVEHHHRDADHRLRHRRYAEDRVNSHGIGLADIQLADGVGVHDLPVALQQRPDAGHSAAVDLLLQRGIDTAKPLG
jgi:hypothetical protein